MKMGLQFPSFTWRRDGAAQLEVLRRHCDQMSRPYEDIERTAIGAFDLSPGGTSPIEAIDYCRALALRAFSISSCLCMACMN